MQKELDLLGATDLLQGVYVVDGQAQVGKDGEPVFIEDVRERWHAAFAHLVAPWNLG